MLKVKFIGSTNKDMEEQLKDAEGVLEFFFGKISFQHGTKEMVSSYVKKITIETLNSVYEFEAVEGTIE